MINFLTAFGVAFGVVVLAEMGDKTQLLAMAFAAKYKTSRVMAGVFIATVLNHALAVAAGNFITRFESAKLIIQGLASLSFIFFGLWTIKGEKQENQGNNPGPAKFGAVITVTLVFFLAEMGDKTQLATIALAAKFPASPAGVLTGTTSAMLVADGLGIFAGYILQKRIPQQKIKLISAGVFVLFGLFGTYELISGELKLNIMYTVIIMAVIILITFVSGYYLLKKYNSVVRGEPELPEQAPRN